MSHTFEIPHSWKEKVLSADSIWSQVKNVLDANNIKIPSTPRRPDVRLIVENVHGVDRMFRNPANHANDKSEIIPGKGDKKAAMIMVAGDTLAAQYENAHALVDRFNLESDGLSSAFLESIAKDRAGGLVKEAYGPAPFNEQAIKLVDLEWPTADGNKLRIAPVIKMQAAFGARAPAEETAFLMGVQIYVQGTTTTPEMVQPGMAIAVNRDWQTGAETTRPIVASVAREFYGSHFDTMPKVTVHPDGYVLKIDLGNGTVFEAAPEKSANLPAPKAAL